MNKKFTKTQWKAMEVITEADGRRAQVRADADKGLWLSICKDSVRKCAQCGDELKISEQTVCFTCSELEINRRYRLHNQIGE